MPLDFSDVVALHMMPRIDGYPPITLRANIYAGERLNRWRRMDVSASTGRVTEAAEVVSLERQVGDQVFRVHLIAKANGQLLLSSDENA
jgi:hypothetical protein